MPKTTLRIDSRALERWEEVFHVLGLTPSHFVERFLSHMGQYSAERACVLDELATNWSHVSRDSAAAVAEKLELWAVDRQLAGQGGLLVADVVRAGRKWQVRIDYLVREGWLSQLPEFYDGEQWREANEE